MPKAIALILHDNKVLLGSSGKWLMDVTRKDKKDELAKKQRSYETDKAKAEAEILKRLPAGVHMKPIVKKPSYYTTKFLKTSPPNKQGFIKGDIEKGESGEEAIAREVEEETFTKFTASRFKKVHGNIFTLELTDAEAKDIVQNWRAQFTKKIGELVALKWEPIKDLKEADVNSDSTVAFSHLPTAGGGRGSLGGRVFSGGESKMATTRSMTRRKTRRAKSHCVGIKRSAVCKRTQGCKQAAGPKRRFCRTAKNRKHSK
jgi:hypothetical protein